MNKAKFLLLGAGLLLAPAANAEFYQAGPDSQAQVNLTGFAMEDDVIMVSFNFNGQGVKMPSKMKTVFQPMLVQEGDTACFANFAIDGRKRWAHEANCNPIIFQGWGNKKTKGQALTPCPAQGDGYALQANNGSYDIALAMPYFDWMGDAFLVLDVQTWGCSTCFPFNNTVEHQYYVLAQGDFLPLVFVPTLLYQTPEAEAVKARDLVSQAYLDFKVGQTTILPKYMNNPKELAAIQTTVNEINNDTDISFNSINIHGMASPEGPFKTNERLAKGRADALKDYMVKNYKLSKDFISTTYEPVINWAGLAAWLESDACKANAANVPNAADILAIVNGNLEDFARNEKIKTTYPDQYNWLLKNVYPSLRVSEYTLNFDVRSYDNVEEIIEVMQTSPNKLSVAELFMAGNSQGTESEVFAEAINVAVNTYPNDQAANLNAGILAMQQGNLTASQSYLSKAGDSDNAKYARAELAALNGDNEKALKEFKALEKSSDATVTANAAAQAKLLEKVIKRAQRK